MVGRLDHSPLLARRQVLAPPCHDQEALCVLVEPLADSSLSSQSACASTFSSSSRGERACSTNVLVELARCTPSRIRLTLALPRAQPPHPDSGQGCLSASCRRRGRYSIERWSVSSAAAPVTCTCCSPSLSACVSPSRCELSLVQTKSERETRRCGESHCSAGGSERAVGSTRSGRGGYAVREAQWVGICDEKASASQLSAQGEESAGTERSLGAPGSSRVGAQQKRKQSLATR